MENETKGNKLTINIPIGMEIDVENSKYCNCDSGSNTYDLMLCRLCACTIYDRIYEIIN